jgi:L,D-transpeptidase ErfK/SrfK
MPIDAANGFLSQIMAGKRSLGALGALLFAAGGVFAAVHGEDVIGAPRTYVTEEEDTLLDIARQFDLGYVEIREANPGVDPWLPGAGRTLTLPTQHVLPDAPHRGIVINLPDLRLYYFSPKGEPRSFPIGIGGEGKETPVGRTEIVAKRIHPAWIPTKSEHEEDPDLPDVFPPGPDNPMGEYALYLGFKGYAIHGTNKAYSIGRRDSHGCIRLYPEDIEQLFKMVAVGTPVTIVNQPAKAGWSGDMLYLEVHPEQSDADWLETQGEPREPGEVDAEPVVLKAAGDQVARLDWYRINLAQEQRNGIAIPVLRP